MCGYWIVCINAPFGAETRKKFKPEALNPLNLYNPKPEGDNDHDPPDTRVPKSAA